MKSGKVQKEAIIPHNAELEISVLGCVIFNNEAFSELSLVLDSDDFYSPVHSEIYKVMGDIISRGKILDDKVLKENLRSLNSLEEIGGASYVDVVKNAACPKSVVKEYAELIRDSSLRRSIIDITRDYNDLSLDETCQKDSKSMMSEIISKMSSLSASKSESERFSSTDEIVDMLFNDEGGRVIETGLACLDANYPIVTQAVTIIAGRPSHGKSTLCASIAKGISEGGYRVDFYSTEMTKSQLAARMISSEMAKNGSNIEYRQLYRKDLRAELTNINLAEAKETAKGLAKVNWNDKSSMTVSDIIIESTYCKEIKDKPDVIIVDYLSKVSKADMRGSELRDDQKIGQIVSRLRDYAKANDCAVIIAVQLGRSVEKMSEAGRPMLAGLKDSGEIEEHADMVLFTYRKARYLEQKYGDDMEEDVLNEYVELLNKIEVICGKQRMGPTGSEHLGCNMYSNYIYCD